MYWLIKYLSLGQDQRQPRTVRNTISRDDRESFVVARKHVREIITLAYQKHVFLSISLVICVPFSTL